MAARIPHAVHMSRLTTDASEECKAHRDGNEHGSSVMRTLARFNVIDPPCASWRREGIRRINEFHTQNKHTHYVYKFFFVGKLVIILASLLYAIAMFRRSSKRRAEKRARKRQPSATDSRAIGRNVHTIGDAAEAVLFYGVASLIGIACVFVAWRFRRFAPAVFRHSPEVVVMYYWEGTFIFFLVTMLLITSLCLILEGIEPGEGIDMLKLFF